MATGRYGGVIYAMHHYFISCEGLTMTSANHWVLQLVSRDREGMMYLFV